MTYLQLVNAVLRRLREKERTSVTETVYSTLIGDLVNDAKEEVEDAWDWSALRTTITANTTAGIFSYSLAGSENKFKTLQVLNETNGQELRYAEAEWVTRQHIIQNPASGQPEFYTFNGVDGNGDTYVELYPIPDDTYVIRFNGIQRNNDTLVNDTDTLWVPSQPVILLAWAKAIEERGEDAGVMSGSAYMTAQRSLADAVSLDSIKHPEETIWRAV